MRSRCRAPAVVRHGRRRWRCTGGTDCRRDAAGRRRGRRRRHRTRLHAAIHEMPNHSKQPLGIRKCGASLDTCMATTTDADVRDATASKFAHDFVPIAVPALDAPGDLRWVCRRPRIPEAGGRVGGSARTGPRRANPASQPSPISLAYHDFGPMLDQTPKPPHGAMDGIVGVFVAHHARRFQRALLRAA